MPPVPIPLARSATRTSAASGAVPHFRAHLRPVCSATDGDQPFLPDAEALPA